MRFFLGFIRMIRCVDTTVVRLIRGIRGTTELWNLD